MSDTDEYQFSEAEFAALLEWYMVSDPWPLSPMQDDRMKEMLNRESRRRGFDSWVHAFHDFGDDDEVPADD